MYKLGTSNEWLRTPDPFIWVSFSQLIRQAKTETGVEVSFRFEFKKQIREYYFAFCYPWSYTDNRKWLDEL